MIEFYLTAGYNAEDLADTIVHNNSYEEIINLIEWIDIRAGDSVFTDMLTKLVKELNKR